MDIKKTSTAVHLTRRAAHRLAAADPFTTTSVRARSARWSIISAVRAPRWIGCPIWRDAAARHGPAGSAARTMRARELAALHKDSASAGRAGRSRLSAAAGRDRRRAAVARRARQHDALMRPMIGIVGSRNASGAGLKFAATAGARSRRCRLCHRVRTGARHRSGGASRKPRKRHPRGAWPAVTTGSIRPSMTTCSRVAERPAARFPKCRSAMCRAPAISRGATG